MLRELRVKNFAVIDEVALDLEPGLNVLTGETGAGKTILLNALAVILGEKVSADVIRSGEEEASVEALFSPLPEDVEQRLKELGLEQGDELVVRRTISRSGRNRSYLNGSVCPLTLLGEIGARLVHIYGQHEHHTLLRPETHLALLNALGGLEEKCAEMRRRYQALAQAWQRLAEAKQAVEQKKREESSLRSQLEEIKGAALQPGEEEELKAKREVLLHAERLIQGCKEGEDLLYESENAVIGRLSRYALRVKELANIDGSLKTVGELLEAAQIQLEEATGVLRRYLDRADFDPRALEKTDDRLAEIGRLKRKYNGSIEDILRLQEQLEAALENLGREEEKIPLLEREFEQARRSAWEFAEALSVERQRAAKQLKKEAEREIKGLGMPGVVFEARFASLDPQNDEPPFRIGGRKMTEAGIDEVEFYFSPNPGEPLKPLAKIASGGELSRVMLALKSLVLTRGDVPTFLFDEVDAGIGGAVAEMVGKKLKKVAESRQVICVTHLPQIAALADAHALVRKEVIRGRTFTSVKKLAERDRIAEVARMLGGVKITERTKKHAEEMVSKRAKADG
ncbi:MAG TPA: DNA repair protein RecN [Candidatus Acidoferrales bacterium]|nr:DNA repair protein RecN [Candidatus Acidoferrales bacterium]